MKRTANCLRALALALVIVLVVTSMPLSTLNVKAAPNGTEAPINDPSGNENGWEKAGEAGTLPGEIQSGEEDGGKDSGDASTENDSKDENNEDGNEDKGNGSEENGGADNDTNDENGNNDDNSVNDEDGNNGGDSADDENDADSDMDDEEAAEDSEEESEEYELILDEEDLLDENIVTASFGDISAISPSNIKTSADGFQLIGDCSEYDKNNSHSDEEWWKYLVTVLKDDTAGERKLRLMKDLVVSISKSSKEDFNDWQVRVYGNATLDLNGYTLELDWKPDTSLYYSKESDGEYYMDLVAVQRNADFTLMDSSMETDKERIGKGRIYFDAYLRDFDDYVADNTKRNIVNVYTKATFTMNGGQLLAGRQKDQYSASRVETYTK